MGRNKFISKKFFMTSVAGFVLSALPVLFLPFASTGTDDTLTGAGIVCGIVFWAGLVTGTVCFILSWYSVRRDAGHVFNTISFLSAFFAERKSL